MPRGRHRDAEVRTLPTPVGAQTPTSPSRGHRPTGTGTSRAQACLGRTGLCSVPQAAPLRCTPASAQAAEREGCVLRDTLQGRQVPSSMQSAGAADGQRALGACEHPHDADHTPSSPRLSKTHPGQGLGEVGSILRRGWGCGSDVQRSGPHSQAHVTSGPSRHSPAAVAASLKVESKNSSCAEGTFKPSNVTKGDGGVRVAVGTPTHSHTQSHVDTHSPTHIHGDAHSLTHRHTLADAHSHRHTLTHSRSHTCRITHVHIPCPNCISSHPPPPLLCKPSAPYLAPPTPGAVFGEPGQGDC